MYKRPIVFISYAKENVDIARHVFDELEHSGVSPWLDEKSIIGGSDWEESIREAIYKSDYFFSLFSSVSVRKKGVIQKELSMALDAKKLFPNTDIFIIPMRIDDCEPVIPEIKKLHWIDLFPNFNEGIRKSLHSITYNEAKKESTTPIKPIRNTIKYKYKNNKWIDRHIGVVTGNIRYILFSEAWVNSENIDFEMARPTEKSISAIIRYLGAAKDENGKIIDDAIYNELIRKRNKKHFPCDVIITGSGELLKTHGVKKIFHVAAVNSEYFSGFSQVKNIENCISNVLIQAEECSIKDTPIKSILFPLLGTGVGHGDLDETIEKLIVTSAKFYDSHINSSIKEIYFIARNLEQLDASKKIFDKIFND